MQNNLLKTVSFKDQNITRTGVIKQINTIGGKDQYIINELKRVYNQWISTDYVVNYFHLKRW